MSGLIFLYPKFRSKGGIKYPKSNWRQTDINAQMNIQDSDDPFILREIIDQFHVLIETIPHGIEIIDTSGTIIFANQSLHKLYEYPKNELVGKSILDFLVSETEKKELKGYLDALINEQPPPAPYIGQKKTRTGKMITVQVDWNYRRDAEGNLLGFTSIITDISNKQRAERSLKMAALGEMAGGIAHEVNTPLGAISLSAQTIRQELDKANIDKDYCKKMTDTILKVTKRISKTIIALRSFSREGGSDPFLDVKVSALIEDTLLLSQEKFKRQGVTLKVDPLDIDETIQCRSNEIVQVIINLFNNALHALETTDDKWVHFKFSDEGKEIQIEVMDSGRGVPPEKIEKIFEPYFTTKAQGVGTGLGLSISKEIIENHGGTLTLDQSSPITRFVIRLPKQQTEEILKSVGMT